MIKDIDTKTIEIVNQLFERLMAISPAFKQAWPTPHAMQATKKEWVLAFQQSNIRSLNQINKALSKFRLHPSPFIPSPGEFLKLCAIDHSDIDAPDCGLAYKEACANSHPTVKAKRWSHPCVKHAWSLVGSWDMQQQSRQKTYPLFEKYYNEALALFASGNLKDMMEDKTKENNKQLNEQLKRDQVSRQFNECKGYDKAMHKIKSMIA